MKYRADIDGLRGVSILFVLLFHLDIAYFSGGFIGVDIFFVISGFVITKNIVSKLSNNSFDLLHFYYKRIRRLLPALFVTLFVSAFIAYLLMSPPDLVRFGGALASSAFSVSNFYFWQEASYFDPSIEIKPLLHTWSLSVEEQFYLFWPLLIIFLTKLNPWQKVVVFLTLILLSLFISVFLGTHSVEAGFYLLPSRVLEFALGASIALWGKSIVKGIVGNVLALTGFFMIFFSAIAFNNEMIYPSYYALLPAIGASLIILSSGGFLGWFLTNQSMLFIGKISYSLYLVHWPVIVFYKYWKFDSLQANDYFFIVVITAFLTLFLWYFIETRYRYSWPIKLSINNHVLKTSFVMMLSVFFVGIYFSKSDGVPSRFPKEFYMSADQVVQERNRYWNKFNKDGRAILKVNDPKDNVMIIGNSHAIDLVYSLRENGSQDNFIFIPTTHKCYNFIIPGKVEDKKICSNVEKKITEYSEWSDLDAVYLHDNWPRNKTSGVEKVIEIIRNTGKSSVPIYIFGPKMTYTKKIPDLARKNLRIYGFNGFAMKYADRDLKVSITRTVKSMLSEKNYKNVYFVDMLGIQCGEDYLKCEVLSGENEFLYFDGGHFTLVGSRLFGRKLKTVYPEFFN